MRVMYVQPGELIGGAERQAVLHISRMRQQGVEVLPVVGPSEALPRALEKEGVSDSIFLDDFFHLTFDRGRSRFGIVSSDLRAGLDFYRTYRQLEALARRHSIDIILASRIFAWIVATPVARRLGLPIVWRAGGCLTTRAEEIGMRLFSRRFSPELLICNSETVRSGLKPHVRCPVDILENGVDTTRFDSRRVAPQLRTELGIDADTPVVAIVARPRPLKNFELLAEILKRTSAELPAVRLLIAGDSASRPHYEQLFAELGLAPRTTFLGHRDDVENVYASCDVAVLTSHSEGSPNAILEAMAMERPVVANGVSGLAEMVQHGVQGFLAPPNDAAKFSEHLVELLRNPQLRTRMGAAGRAVVMERFSDVVAARQLAERLRTVVKNSKRTARTGEKLTDGPEMMA